MDTFLKPEVIWFVLGLVLILMEFVTPGFYVIFFGFGAWVVSAVSLFAEVSLTWQLLLFLVSSVLMLVFLRTHLQNLFGVNTVNDMDEKDEFIGEEGIVIEKISINGMGKIELRGTQWDARSNSDIDVGTRVRVTARDSIRFTVEPLN
ncbi:MAG TPA: NfeD family protein [Caldithrix abyssi]|uniref:NfeD family protein n=1 Tax=Caldithrix abyssi TaxID=187145 RepID=A0A7V5VE28_CALAY|nr:NfeD family protein [Caldithrix abyssi]